MNNKKFLLIISALFVASAGAEQPTTTVSGSDNQINFAYSGDDTRLGIGVDNEGELVADFLKSFNSDWRSNWMGGAWYSDGAGGLKLDFLRLSGAAEKGDLISNQDNLRVWKYFLALDQNTFDDRKFTLGFGSEANNFFWNINGSKSITDERLTRTTVTSVNDILNGTENGRDYTQNRTIETTIREYAHPYKWGLGGRVGKFFDQGLLRLTGGIDYEKGDFSSRQLTGSINLEKYFNNSPHSLALNLEHANKDGHFVMDKNDTRAFLMYRYDFGKNHQPLTTVEEVEVVDEERLAQLKLEKRKLIQNEVSLASTAFFDLDSATIRDDAKQELMKLVDALKGKQLVSDINVVGHTCDIGTDAYNQSLSERRADSAKAFLVESGLSTDLIKPSGQGEKNPKYDNNSSEKEKNRRVEIAFLSLEKDYQEIEIADDEMPMKWVTKEVQAPAAWISRALRNPAQHKRTVDYYTYQEKSTKTSLGDRVYVNRNPVANGNSITIARNSSGVVIDVLANDTDPDPNTTLTISEVTQPSNGTVVNNSSNVTYTPTTGFIGEDTFTYTIDDGNGGTATATVTVTVENVPPQAQDDSVTTTGSEATSIDVLANDSDPDNGTLSVIAITQPSNGTASINDDGSITYQANAEFVGSDSFTYTITDGDGGESTATVFVTVLEDSTPPVGSDPTATDDKFVIIMLEGNDIDLNVLQNDYDTNGNSLTITKVSQPTRGGAIATVNEGGKSINFATIGSGDVLDQFTYTISNEKGGSATATVNIHVIDY